MYLKIDNILVNKTKNNIEIRGRKLEKIKNVYFGNIKVDENNVKLINNNLLEIVPPDFTLYEKLIEDSGSINLELKLLISDNFRCKR